MPERRARATRSLTRSGFTSPARCSSVTSIPSSAIETVRATSSADTPDSAAFVRWVSNTKRVALASTVESMSDTPGSRASRAASCIAASRTRAYGTPCSPYNSAVTVASTGGPGGDSTSAILAPARRAIASSEGRRRRANSWDCSARSCLPTRPTRKSATFVPSRRKVWRTRPLKSIGEAVPTKPATSRTSGVRCSAEASSRATASVRSSVASSGMSIITCNSFLLSNGNILSGTARSAASASEAAKRAPSAHNNRLPRRSSSRNGVRARA